MSSLDVDITCVARGVRVDMPGRPPTINAERAEHWHAHRRTTREWRELAGWAARQARLAAISAPVVVTSWPTYRTGRSWPDVGAWAPATKAVIDGLVDAGLLAGDTAETVRYVSSHPPVRGERDG
ncbi:MAG: hypothetical protein KJ056_12620, partial [Acidimicrobiia bacterium]|nr:hypothetical protein [Acidimicrobiia bacterium]